MGLLETLWKVVEALIYIRLRSSIHFRDVLQGFQDRRGVGAAVIELKLAQDIASVV